MAKRGRPPRADATSKALAGVDIDSVDPLQVLREIAADGSAPAAARVTAAKALLAHNMAARQKPGDGSELDRVSQRALVLLKGGKR